MESKLKYFEEYKQNVSGYLIKKIAGEKREKLKQWDHTKNKIMENTNYLNQQKSQEELKLDEEEDLKHDHDD